MKGCQFFNIKGCQLLGAFETTLRAMLPAQHEGLRFIGHTQNKIAGDIASGRLVYLVHCVVLLP